MRAFHTSLLSLFFVFSHIHSVVIRDDVPDKKYTAYSKSEHFFPVGSVKCNGLSSTGTLISPQTVLVAAHAIDNKTTATFSIFHPKKNQTIHVKGKTLRHKDYSRKFNDSYHITSLFNDIGLIFLDKPIAGIKPAKIWTEMLDDNIPCCCCGFGKTGTGLTGPTKSDARRRGFTNTITGFIQNSSFDSLYVLYFHPPGDEAATSLEGVGSEGDSGAPVFVQVDDTDQFYLVGILNLLIKKGVYHSYNAALPMVFYPDWLEKNVR